jgi:hypothetical protein
MGWRIDCVLARQLHTGRLSLGHNRHKGSLCLVQLLPLTFEGWSFCVPTVNLSEEHVEFLKGDRKGPSVGHEVACVAIFEACLVT